MTLEQNIHSYHPASFFSWVFLLSWTPWIVAAYYSYNPDQAILTISLALLGLLGPALGALIMLRHASTEIKADCKHRLLAVSSISLPKLLFILAVILFTLLGATWLSIQMGANPKQFQFSGSFIGMLPLALIAALLEELGWRSYGMDSLKAQMNMISATLFFALLWALWHVPLFFIQETYQHGLWLMGPIYVANFFISVLPATILANWFYYKSQRSIPAAVFFHFALVACAELLQTEPTTKILVTVLLGIVSILLILSDRRFFFAKQSTVIHTKSTQQITN